MTIIERLGSWALIAAGLALASSVSAQSIDVGAGINGSVNIGQNQPTSSTDADIDATIDITETTATDTATDTDTDTATGTDMGTSSAAGTTSAAEVITVTRSDVGEEESRDIDASEVSTSADLSAYARSVIQGDENVSQISSSAESVSLWYKDRARLLGFIPVTVSAEARIDSQGTVSVTYPWYSFLTTYNSEDLESMLDARAGSIARAEGGAGFTARAQARILDEMKTIMESHYESNLEADAGTSSRVEIE